jgi:hypothetical protein
MSGEQHESEIINGDTVTHSLLQSAAPATPQSAATSTTSGLHATLQAKLATVLATRTSESELVQALKHVSILMNESASRGGANVGDGAMCCQ